jgi:N-formylglutamate deformylase
VLPFDVIEPRGGDSPLLVEVPHAGLSLDAGSLALTVAPARSIARDADLHVDAIFQDAPAEGATLLVARASRYVVDLNRAEDDCDALAVEDGALAASPRGVLWRLTTDGAPILAAPLPRAELERRLDAVYRPYHRLLHTLIERKLARFGFAVLLCAHSMPSAPRPGAPGGAAGPTNGAARRPGPAAAWKPDIVPGTRGRTTAAADVIDRVDAHARAFGYRVRHDDPYRGGYSTARYGKPGRGVHAIQVEIARRLYLDEDTLRIDPQGFASVREFGRTLVARLLFTEPDAPLDRLSSGPTGASARRGREG